MRWIKQALIATICTASLLGSVLLRAEQPPMLIEVEDFARLGEQVLARDLPIVLAVVAEDCPYCRQLEREILRPMMISGDYEGKKALIRTLHLDRGEPLPDFNRQARSARAIAADYRVFVTPTLLFLDSHGRELAERMVGINTVDFYGAYLDRGIEQSLSQLRERRAASLNDARPAGAGG